MVILNDSRQVFKNKLWLLLRLLFNSMCLYKRISKRLLHSSIMNLTSGIYLVYLEVFYSQLLRILHKMTNFQNFGSMKVQEFMVIDLYLDPMLKHLLVFALKQLNQLSKTSVIWVNTINQKTENLWSLTVSQKVLDMKIEIMIY